MEQEARDSASLKQDILQTIPTQHHRLMLSDQISRYNGELDSLQEQKRVNDERLNMLQEDLVTSQALLFELVQEREHLEQMTGLTSMRALTERALLAKFLESQSNSSTEAGLFKLILDHRKNQLLLALIRQLQQYMLSLNSGTTDASFAHSDTLDKLYLRIEEGLASVEEAVQVISAQAARIMNKSGKMPVETLTAKLKEFDRDFDRKQARALIAEVKRDLDYLSQLEKRIDYFRAVSKGKLQAQIVQI